MSAKTPRVNGLSVDSNILCDTSKHGLSITNEEVLQELEIQTLPRNELRITGEKNSTNNASDTAFSNAPNGLIKSFESTVTRDSSLSSFPTNLNSPSQSIMRSASQKRLHAMNRIRQSGSDQTSLNYRGTNIYDASRQGNYPIFVVLWGIATTKYLNLMVPDGNGNTPLHHVSMSHIGVSPEGACDVSKYYFSIIRYYRSNFNIICIIYIVQCYNSSY
jgi:hypothetical protein